MGQGGMYLNQCHEGSKLMRALGLVFILVGIAASNPAELLTQILQALQVVAALIGGV